MCLANITRRIETPSTRVRRAYKIMNKNGYTPFNETLLPVGKWCRAEERPLLTENWFVLPTDFGLNRELYASGFHTYPSLKAAKKAFNFLGNLCREIVAVQVKEVAYTGTDGTSGNPKFEGIPNLVSRWIRVIPKSELKRKRAKK